MSARAESSDPGGEPRQPWWSSAGDSRHADDGRSGRGDRDAAGSGGPSARGADGSQATTPPHDHPHCRVCPICSFLQTLDDTRPEVVEHLTEAARHLTLAAKTFIDAQAAGFDTQDDVLERIPLDDD